ncbi:Glutathione transport system permease protein GsiC [Aminobacter sp. MSH1]|uniref:ABC-type dipeptide/oligopeptide/nickel transport system permease component n=1 Tax=Aminobacter carboxidus TaxID=376165 RepID=A0A8E1WA35_9HYPH|nr:MULTISPECIES: ABC transporter permease [Aminobacter]AWC20887.1 Glutathione transport system permease protein GsiC [Aminobacter sp. MSH1]MBB6464881.1 ABC-type dipeptide/oligopeptide/nickel transport system permease component [Aminobacter lissarensis]
MLEFTKKMTELILLLLCVSFLAFMVPRLIPGDPARLFAGLDAPAEVVAAIRTEWGFDQPLVVQYWTFLTKALQGDLGFSIHFKQPVMQEVLIRLPSSIELAVAATAISVLIGVPLGIASALHRRKLLDKVATFSSILGVSTPIFVAGLCLMYIFSMKLGWFPASGRGSLSKLILPALTLGLYNTALITRLTRSTMLDALNTDYIRTARAKGLSERVVIYKHALRNAILPVYTIVGLNIGYLIGSAVIIEVVFGRGGLGSVLVDAVKWRDYPLAQGSILVFAIVIILVNRFVDWSYPFVDPRIKGN